MTVKALQAKHIPDVEVLRAARAFHAGDGPMTGTALSARYPEKVVYAKLGRLIRRNLLDYGTSPRSAWLTDEGAALLDRLEREG